MTQTEALDILWRSDHVFLRPEVAIDIQKVFGMKPYVQTQRANTGYAKGLAVGGVGRNAKVQGFDAADLAQNICEYLNLDYGRAEGRGTRLRNACEAIQGHLNGGS